MFVLVNSISFLEWFRIFIVYGHVIISAFALTTVLKADFKMLVSGISSAEIEDDGKNIFILLAALWVSGLTIIYIDTEFSADLLMANGKLLLKLVCVAMLTANGIVLHLISLPILERETVKVSYTESVLLSLTGALSTSHWMLAAFIGMSAPLGRIPFSTLLNAYWVFLIMLVLVAFCFVAVIRRVKIGIAGRRANDPPAARRKKLLSELISTPRCEPLESDNIKANGKRTSDKEIQQSKLSNATKLCGRITTNCKRLLETPLAKP